MRSHTIRGKMFTRRALVLTGLKVSLLMSLMGRLYYLQVIKSEKYKTLSDSNRIRLSIIPPMRGKIFDTSGEELAVNQNFYRILFDPFQVKHKEKTLERLAEILGLSIEQKELMLSKIKERKSGHRIIMLYDHLTWQQVAKVEVRSPELHGISIDIAQRRHYPYSEQVAHIVGYVGAVSPKEKERNNPLLDYPDFHIGKTGVEKIYDSELRGKAGFKRTEVNAYGRQVRELSREPSKAGDDIHLTIDMHMQRFITKKLPKKGGAVVLLDILTGDILSMVSTPSFDPNKFVQNISKSEWKELQQSPYTPLINKAIGRQYPPGSTFKIVTALSGLDAGIDPDEKVYCPGYYDFGDRRFHCWRKEGHGHVNMHEAIKYSCNTYYYEMSQRIGIDRLSRVAEQCGLGHEYGIGTTNELDGLVPNRKWKKKKYRRSWLKGDTLNTSIGQGFLLATPLQLAVMTARIASNGKMVVPSLVKKPEELSVFDQINLPHEYFTFVKQGMYSVVNHYGGTARGSMLDFKNYQMAGKTGTAQVVARHVNFEKEEKDIPWFNRNHALFVGFAPFHQPRYVLSIVADHGGSGAVVAAPLAKTIFTELHRYNKKRGIV